MTLEDALLDMDAAAPAAARAALVCSGYGMVYPRSLILYKVYEVQCKIIHWIQAQRTRLVNDSF